MKCNELEGIVTQFLDGEVDKKTAAVIQTHLIECCKCRKLVDEITKSFDHFKDEFLKCSNDASGEQIDFEPKHSELVSNDIMTLRSLALYLKVNISDIYSIIDQLPCIEINGKKRFQKASIDHWLKVNENKAFSDFNYNISHVSF